MIRRHRPILSLPLLAAVPLLLLGCAALRPDHLTVFARHAEAETTGGVRRTRTTTNEAGASVTFDFPRPK